MPTTDDQRRARLIKLVHIGKAKLGLDRDAYESLLVGAAGKASSIEMTEKELRSVLLAMAAAGFTPSASRHGSPLVHPEEMPLCSKDQVAYIGGLWALASRSKTRASLVAFVQRLVGIDDLRFLDGRAASRVILALRDMATKAGYNPDGPGEGRAS